MMATAEAWSFRRDFVDQKGDEIELVAVRIDVDGRVWPITAEVANAVNTGKIASFNLRYSLDVETARRLYGTPLISVQLIK
jgi:hypothetical protein